MGLKAGFLGFFFFVWIIGAFLGSTFEYHTSSTEWAGSGTGGYEQSPVTTTKFLLDINNVTQRTEILGGISIPTPNGEYFKAAGKILLWEFSFLYNTDGTLAYGLVYYLLFLPFALMGILSLILLVYGILTGNLTLT